MVPKSSLKTQYGENWKKCMFSTLVSTTLNMGQNSPKSPKNRCPCFSLKRVSKSNLKFSISSKSTKEHIFNLRLTNVEQIAPNLRKVGVHAYFSIGYLNIP